LETLKGETGRGKRIVEEDGTRETVEQVKNVKLWNKWRTWNCGTNGERETESRTLQSQLIILCFMLKV
jgi:hypothetical protein